MIINYTKYEVNLRETLERDLHRNAKNEKNFLIHQRLYV